MRGLAGRVKLLCGLAFRSGYTGTFQAEGNARVRRAGVDCGEKMRKRGEVCSELR
jgi:hypothetical protein